MYKIITHEEAKKYKEYILSGSVSSSPPKAQIYNTKLNLEQKLNAVLSNKEFFEEQTSALKEEFLPIFQDLKLKIVKCELLLLGVRSLPVILSSPKFRKPQNKFKLADFIIRMVNVEDSEEERSVANFLIETYPDKSFWSNIFTDEGFKVNSLKWFLSDNGQIFLKQQLAKYILEK